MTAIPWPRYFPAESLAVLRTCAYQYERRYVEGIPERPFSSLGRAAGEVGPAQMGEIVHRCLEVLDFTSEVDLSRLVREAAASLGLPAPVEAQEEEMREMLERLLGSPLGELMRKSERQHEVPFVCRIPSERLEPAGRGTQDSPDSDPPLEASGLPSEICIRGKVDCLLTLPGGGIQLLDYKTHGVKADEVPAVLPQHEFQIQVYAYALGQAAASGQSPLASHRRPLTAVLWYLRAGLAREVEVWPMEKAEKEIVSSVAASPHAPGVSAPRRSELDRICFLCGYYPWACPGGGPAA